MPEKFRPKDIFPLLKEAFVEWNANDPFYMSAAISYYTLFALPGLLVLISNIAGAIWKEEEVKAEITRQISESVGPESAAQIETIMTRALADTGSTISFLFSFGSLIFGATGVFFILQKSLNKVWDVEIDPKSGVLHVVRSRLVGLGLIIAIGFLLLVSLLLTTGLNVLSQWIKSNLPEFLYYGFFAVHIILSIAVITLLFAAIYKFLPDVIIGWRSLWIGSFFTALLFVLGKFLLGLYFGHSNPASAYGVAGSIVVLLLWVSYSSLIVFFGAEFTQAYARRYGQPIAPAKNAFYVKRQMLKKLEE